MAGVVVCRAICHVWTGGARGPSATVQDTVSHIRLWMDGIPLIFPTRQSFWLFSTMSTCSGDFDLSVKPVSYSITDSAFYSQYVIVHRRPRKCFTC